MEERVRAREMKQEVCTHACMELEGWRGFRSLGGGWDGQFVCY